MIKSDAPRIHFLLLVLGIVLYALTYPGIVTLNNGVPEANIVDIERLRKNTIYFMVFVILVFEHALLWRSPSEHTTLTDEEKEKIEEIKSQLKKKNKLQ